MNRILNYTISDADAGMIVLDFLRKQGFSRHILTAMKADKEALSVNDQKVGGRTILCAGDHFRVRLLETVSPDGIIPASMDIPVLYEDEDILVVNKPADMPVHPSIGNYTNTPTVLLPIWKPKEKSVHSAVSIVSTGTPQGH